MENGAENMSKRIADIAILGLAAGIVPLRLNTTGNAAESYVLQ